MPGGYTLCFAEPWLLSIFDTRLRAIFHLVDGLKGVTCSIIALGASRCCLHSFAGHLRTCLAPDTLLPREVSSSSPQRDRIHGHFHNAGSGILYLIYSPPYVSLGYVFAPSALCEMCLYTPTTSGSTYQAGFGWAYASAARMRC